MAEAFDRGARFRHVDEADLTEDFQARLLALCEADLNIEGLWLVWMTSPGTEPELHAVLLARDRREQVARDFIRQADALGGPRFVVGFPVGIPKAKPFYLRSSQIAPKAKTSCTNFRELCGYERAEDAYDCAKRLKDADIECVLRYRGRGLFGDVLTSEFTWVDVPAADYDRASELVISAHDSELLCPQCGSKNSGFEVSSCRFSCEDCGHAWDEKHDT